MKSIWPFLALITVPFGNSPLAADNAALPSNSAQHTIPFQGDKITIRPSVGCTTGDTIAGVLVGTINFSNLNQVLQVYADLAGKTILCSGGLSNSSMDLTIEGPLTPKQQVAALDVMLALNQVGLISLPGDRVWATTLSGGCDGSASDDALIPFVTHALPLSYASPGDLVEILRPLASDNGHGILPLDSEHLLVLHDHPDNVKRMVDLAFAQVLIEAAVMEVSLPDSKLPQKGSRKKDLQEVSHYSLAQGMIEKSNLLSIAGFTSDALAESATNRGTGFSYLGRSTNDFDTTLTALASDSRVTILQRPRIQTGQSVTAYLFIGEAQPTTGWSGASCGRYSSIQHMNIGVSFEITPRINSDRRVAMDFCLTTERVSGSTNIANVGKVPLTTRTQMKAKVVTNDKEMMVLGGPIRTVAITNSSGFPLLKRIPFAGGLFRHSSVRTVNRELIVLIRLTILPMPQVGSTIPKVRPLTGEL